jgi:hypothetical protein
MAVVLGTNSGFCASAPTADPAATNVAICTASYGVGACTKHTAPAGATLLTEIGWWWDSGYLGSNVEYVLYAHDAANDRPGAVLWASRTNSPTGSAGAWMAKSGLSVAITAGTVYWIGVLSITATGTGNMNRGSITGARYASAQLSTFPDPWTANGAANFALAIYALYSTGGGQSVVPVLLNQRRRRM